MPFALPGRLLLLLAFAAMGRALPGQEPPKPSAAARPAFHYDVVNIRETKPQISGGTFSMNFQVDPHSSHLTMENTNYRMLLNYAFGISGYQIENMPRDLPFAFFIIRLSADDEVDAALKAMPDDEAKEMQQRMLQEVLVERFHLKSHFVTREMPSYVLVAGKPTMHLSAIKPPAKGEAPLKMVKGDPTTPWVDFKFTPRGWDIGARGVSMDWLARTISGHIDAPVANQTALPGLYDFTLQWSMPFQNRLSASASAASADQDLYPPVEAAVAQQLGLRLEHGKAPMQMLVIDHLEPPTPN